MMIKTVLFSIILTIPSILLSQSHWESIVVESDTWNYLAAVSEPPIEWSKIDFDDVAWEKGIGGIGYGDNDDATIIDPVNSLYLRKAFVVNDVSIVEKLLLDIDYDDAFVAYINGVEIARSQNIIENAPSFNSSLTSIREAIMYQGGLPERYTIDLSVLNEGNNLLAIQIINTDVSSSDLSSRVYLNTEIDSDVLIYNDVPDWFIEPTEPIVLTSSNLPIVVINTNDEAILDDPKIEAHMGIINNSEGLINEITNAFTDYDGRIKIEIRGESSQDLFPKKSYLFETQDEQGENNNVSLLGMPEENDWILYAPYSDKSMLRNVITYELGRITGNYCSRTAFQCY